MRIDNDDSTPSSWMGWKEKGRMEYERGNYEAAVDAYRMAVTSFGNICPADERQIMLSNMVACRLKIGGKAQAEAAIIAAKQCIAINPQWAKGHVRLASAYIALGDKGKSNDACNALQRALQLDPGNPTARDMLIRELRRDHPQQQQAGASAASASPSAPPEDQDDQTYPRPSSSSSTQQQQQQTYQDQPYQDQPYQDRPPQPQQQQANNNNMPGIDDSISWRDKIWFYYQRTQLWYAAQSDEVKTALQVFMGLILLYIAFGGRFGLNGTSTTPTRRGNYGAGNAYDRYYDRGVGRESAASYPYDHTNNNNNNDNGRNRYDSRGSGSSSSSTTNTYERQYQQQQQPYRSNNNNNNRQQHYRQDDDYYYSSSQQQQQRQQRRGNSFQFPNLFDGSPQSMLIMAGIGYLCYRTGINPMQVFMILNMMGGGRRGRRRGGMGYGGMGGFGRRRW